MGRVALGGRALAGLLAVAGSTLLLLGGAVVGAVATWLDAPVAPADEADRAAAASIPVNLGAGTNQTEIYFADWNDVVIGEQDNMTIDFSREATYVDAAGELVSAFARNQSLIRLVGNHDVGFRHPEGLVLGTAVTW